VFLCLRWHPRLRFLGAGGLGVLVFSLASAFCIRASGVAFRFLPLRQHPRFAFVLQASPSGFSRCASIRVLHSCFRRCLPALALALASASCLRTSSVAPVRGGTYFSLPPQRKVGKRKRLTPPTLLPA
jgi:hypothetical protein